MSFCKFFFELNQPLAGALQLQPHPIECMAAKKMPAALVACEEEEVAEGRPA
jgi:hypothetical protein